MHIGIYTRIYYDYAELINAFSMAQMLPFCGLTWWKKLQYLVETTDLWWAITNLPYEPHQEKTCLWDWPAQLQRLASILGVLNLAHIGSLLSRQRTTKALIRLRGCAGWSVPLLFAYMKTGFVMSWLNISVRGTDPESQQWQEKVLVLRWRNGLVSVLSKVKSWLIRLAAASHTGLNHFEGFGLCEIVLHCTERLISPFIIGGY